MSAEAIEVHEALEAGDEIRSVGIKWQTVLLCGLSLSIGWGIRGNYGHEIGAMIPGALTAMAIALLSERSDWRRRVAYFGLFGALGWGFGGTMSFMYEISYTHSGDSATVLYGFAMLFVIGFLWGAMGGAGTGLPAFLTRERLVEFFIPMTVIFAVWYGWDIFDLYRGSLLNGAYRHEDPLYWYDTDWLAAALALVAVLVQAALRRRYDKAASLVVHLCVGWFVPFLLLVDLPDRIGIALGHGPMGLHMNPPRGDAWAGMVGMVGGMLVYFQRNKLTGLTFVSLVAGLFGGLAFATAALFQLIELKSGWGTNWHSVLEQTWGFINGVGIAIAMGLAMPRSPKLSDDPPIKRWTDAWAAYFVLIVITYLNLQANPVDWYKGKLMNHVTFHLKVEDWFALGYLGIAIAAFVLVRRHMRKPIAIVPSTWLGKGQLIYLTFLWIMVVGNFGKALGGFTSQRLITEYVIFWNGIFATLLVLLVPGEPKTSISKSIGDFTPLIRKAIMYGGVAVVVMVFTYWGTIRTIYGNHWSGFGGQHYRFGPRANEIKMKKGAPHP